MDIDLEEVLENNHLGNIESDSFNLCLKVLIPPGRKCSNPLFLVSSWKTVSYLCKSVP